MLKITREEKRGSWGVFNQSPHERKGVDHYIDKIQEKSSIHLIEREKRKKGKPLLLAM